MKVMTGEIPVYFLFEDTVEGTFFVVEGDFGHTKEGNDTIRRYA